MWNFKILKFRNKSEPTVQLNEYLINDLFCFINIKVSFSGGNLLKADSTCLHIILLLFSFNVKNAIKIPSQEIFLSHFQFQFTKTY